MLRTQMNQSLARPCTRICARTSGILLTIRVQSGFAKNRRFPFVKWPFLETKSDALKATISES